MNRHILIFIPLVVVANLLLSSCMHFPDKDNPAIKVWPTAQPSARIAVDVEWKNFDDPQKGFTKEGATVPTSMRELPKLLETTTLSALNDTHLFDAKPSKTFAQGQNPPEYSAKVYFWSDITPGQGSLRMVGIFTLVTLPAWNDIDLKSVIVLTNNHTGNVRILKNKETFTFVMWWPMAPALLFDNFEGKFTDMAYRQVQASIKQAQQQGAFLQNDSGTSEFY
jgi:hypothetical protein